jgi:dienelactone hydrolase
VVLRLQRLPSGAELRVRGPQEGAAVICVNGGQRAEVEGTWSASLEWLVERLAPRFPALRFGEVRYRVKSWNRLDSCVEDGREAIRAVAARRTLLVGFSMGGAVAALCADEPSVQVVVGLAPWLPEQLPLGALRERRFVVVHGSLDRALPGVPGVSAASSRRGFARAQALGVEGHYSVVRGAVHGLALRAPRGTPVPLPGARRLAARIESEIARFAHSS